MALDSTGWGNSVAAAIKGLGVTAGSPVSDATLQLLWRTICGEHKTEFNTNAGIDLQAADIPVPAAGILDSVAGPCTGSASSGATGELTGRIK